MTFLLTKIRMTPPLYVYRIVLLFCVQDILKSLRIPRALVLETSFDRPNLKYEVIGKTNEPLKQLGELLKSRFKNMCGIVYCLSKSECLEVSKFLNEKYKFKTVHYHAGLSARERISAQRKWNTCEVDVVCATIAFGMGIDKPDVVSIISGRHSIKCSLNLPILVSL